MILSRRATKHDFSWDMTPMIDVVLQLIIFFLFTSSFSQVLRSPIDLPEQPGDTTPAMGSGTVVIDIDHQGQYLIEGEVRPIEQVVQLVKLEQTAAAAGGRSLELLIRPDRSIPAMYVNTLANQLASIGVRQWKLGTRVPAGGNASGANRP